LLRYFRRLFLFLAGSNVCTSRGVTTCQQCLTVDPSCAWCSQETFGMGGSGVFRCDLKQNLLDGGCSDEALESPASTLAVLEDKALSDKASGAGETVTQIQPQKIRMVLRPGGAIDNPCHG
uniref:Integrin beta 3a n=1 Tax=Hippocampus comes TaxID=109280 RepID=A0A3Q2XKH9_HIPCM